MTRVQQRLGRAGLAGVGLAVTGLLASACGPTFTDLPLPGSGVSGDTRTVKFQFDEALNLATGATVKVNGVDYGKVQEVATKDFKAVVTATMQEDAQIREDATARLRYSTPLGELYVDVRNPAVGTEIADEGMLDPQRASVAPTVEDALSQASLLINGGGLAQLQVVTTELNEAIGGREQTVKQLLNRSHEFTRQANAATADFVTALEALATLSKTLEANEQVINRAIREVRPAARVLREQTPEFTQLLQEVNRFATTANHVVGETRQDLLTMINQISPILDEMLANQPVLSRSLNALTSASKHLDDIFPGDYWNLSAKLELTSALSLLDGPDGGGGAPTLPGSPGPTPGNLLPDPGEILSGGGLGVLNETLGSLDLLGSR